MRQRPSDPQWPEGMYARTFILGQDEQATYQVDEEAAEDKGYHQPLDFEGWLRRMGTGIERFDPNLWFLACTETELVGVALNFYDKRSNTGWVDHLGVRRAWRKRGIGKALLLHSFGEFYRRDIRRVKLSVDLKSLTNAQHLYESVGMKTVQQYRVYSKTLAV